MSCCIDIKSSLVGTCCSNIPSLCCKVEGSNGVICPIFSCKPAICCCNPVGSKPGRVCNSAICCCNCVGSNPGLCAICVICSCNPVGSNPGCCCNKLICCCNPVGSNCGISLADNSAISCWIDIKSSLDGTCCCNKPICSCKPDGSNTGICCDSNAPNLVCKPVGSKVGTCPRMSAFKASVSICGTPSKPCKPVLTSSGICICEKSIPDRSICGNCVGTCCLSTGIVTPPIPVPKNPTSSGTCGTGGVTGGTNI